MAKKVIIIDTSVLCVWLKVPGKTTTGKNNAIDYEYVSNYIQTEIKKGTQLVLPLTTLIETGNFVAHCKSNKEPSVTQMVDIINDVADGTTPWIALESQKDLLKGDKLKDLAKDWQTTVITENQSIGDAAIVKVAQDLASLYDVEIFTGDGGLKNYECKIAGRQLRRNRR